MLMKSAVKSALLLFCLCAFGSSLNASKSDEPDAKDPTAPAKPAAPEQPQLSPEVSEFLTKQFERLQNAPPEKQGKLIKEMAMEARSMPSGEGREMLMMILLSRCTEGHSEDVVQTVVGTAEKIVNETKPATSQDKAASLDEYLAFVVHYTGVKAVGKSEKYKAAIREFEEADRKLPDARFTLPDLDGKSWTLDGLRGKLVVVNFWNTWCPPCVQELPDLEALSRRYKKDVVVLGLVDEEAGVVREFVEKNSITFPILLDKDGQARKAFGVFGVPRTLVYDRSGKLTTHVYDLRSKEQFEAMLTKAGLKQQP
jgi:peroxiredoxin